MLNRKELRTQGSTVYRALPTCCLGAPGIPWDVGLAGFTAPVAWRETLSPEAHGMEG